MAKMFSASAIIWISIVIFLNIINCIHSENFEESRLKRQIADGTTEYKNIPAATSSSSTTPNVSPTITLQNTTVGVKKDVKPEPPGKNSSEEITIHQATSSTPVIKEKPLLGVNGTGQRKDYSILNGSTAKPAVISEPINPTQKTTKLSTPKKVLLNNEQQKPTSTTVNTTITTGQTLQNVSSEEDIFDEVDVAENNTYSETKKNKLDFKEDYHIYYKSLTRQDPVAARESIEMLKNVTPNHMLSKSHRRAMTVQLTFDFPFYGHLVRNVTVATGGFLYTGDYVHSWLAATQYIAPLMANFDTSLSNDSFVKYVDNGTAFTVLWENVYLQDKQDVGTFTFSATLHKNGDIVFIYNSVPMAIELIQDDKHPVKVGLSDAYIIDKVVFFARRKTIYEYHRVNFANMEIQNSTIIYLAAQPTCLSLMDCHSCLTAKINFTCSWCPALNKCSTGTDRKRQTWLYKGCDKVQIIDPQTCPAIGEKGNNAAASTESSIDGDTMSSHDKWLPVPSSSEHLHEHTSVQQKSVISTYDKTSLGLSSLKPEEKGRVGLVFGLMLPLCLVMCVLAWVLYAYRNPHTKSGQLLIQYRPSQWTWRRGEARYTAATIHM